MLSFSPVVRIGTPPTPYPQASVSPAPLVQGGGAHSLSREGESQYLRGDIHCGTLYISVLCGYNVYLPRRGPYGVSYQYAYGRYDPEVVGGGPPVYGVPASPFHMEYTTATPPAHPRACCQCPDSGTRAPLETPTVHSREF